MSLGGIEEKEEEEGHLVLRPGLHVWNVDESV